MVDVILVDDDKIVLKLLKPKFERFGLSVEAYSNPIEGLDKIVEKRPKMAIIDLMMPQMMGSDIAIKLSEKLVFTTTTIYLLTASDLKEQDFFSLSTLGFQKVLKKPFSDQDVQALVSEHFSKVA
ncbi:MAG: hypothetical protein Fur0010_25250 [Bdellovibrio sp.]